MFGGEHFLFESPHLYESSETSICQVSGTWSLKLLELCYITAEFIKIFSLCVTDVKLMANLAFCPHKVLILKQNVSKERI